MKRRLFEHPELPLQFLRLVQCANCREDHHLIWDKQKGWEMKFTVLIGKKIVGKRKRLRLKTRDLEIAKVKRDAVFDVCRLFGLTVADRRQNRWAERWKADVDATDEE